MKPIHPAYQAEGNRLRQVRLSPANMISGQGSHFAQVNVGKKKKQGKGRHRLAPPAAKPAAANKSPAQVRSAILADAAPSENKAPVEKPRPLSFTQG